MTALRAGLTSEQRRCFEAIVRHQAAHGETPTFSELAVALGMKSRSGVFRLLEALVERGYIIRLPRRARSITIVPDHQAAGDALTLTTRARLEAWCREHDEEPNAIINDVVALWLDEDAGAVAA